jgi:hypothetical protein
MNPLNPTIDGRYISPSELDQIEDLLDAKAPVKPSLAQCIAMVMEIRDARGWKRLDGAEGDCPDARLV